MELPAHRLFLSDSINFRIQAWEFIQVDLTLQKRITRMPRFIRNRITLAASEMELHLPRLGCLGSRSLGFQMRTSLRPEGEPSSVKTSRLVPSSPNIFSMWAPGFANVALQEMN